MPLWVEDSVKGIDRDCLLILTVIWLAIAVTGCLLLSVTFTVIV